MTHIEGGLGAGARDRSVRASDLNCERLRKDGASPEAIICDYFNIRFFESDAILGTVVQEEYTRSLSAEDRLVYGAGLRPLTARSRATSRRLDCRS